MQVANIVAAKTGEIIDEETAVNAGAPIFGVQDAAAMLAKIQDAHQKQLAMGMGPEYGGENEPPPPPPAPDANEPPGPPAGQGGKP
jgi:hypothetical protein